MLQRVTEALQIHLLTHCLAPWEGDKASLSTMEAEPAALITVLYTYFNWRFR